ncbi:hypothetical protein B296_00028955, partial [Ensete ventricosum]
MGQSEGRRLKNVNLVRGKKKKKKRKKKIMAFGYTIMRKDVTVKPMKRERVSLESRPYGRPSQETM